MHKNGVRCHDDNSAFVGAGVPAKNPTRRLAPAAPVFAGSPAPTGTANSWGLRRTCGSPACRRWAAKRPQIAELTGISARSVPQLPRTLEVCAVPVGAWLAGDGPQSGPNSLNW